MRLHGARDDILLREVARLFLGEFAGGDEVEHQRVVAGAEDNACSRTQLIDSAVADVSHQHAVAAAGCKGEGGAHGAARGWGSVYRVEFVVGCFERRLKHGAHLGGGAERQDCRLLAPVLATQALATSPCSWPPMPSHTKNTRWLAVASPMAGKMESSWLAFCPISL